MNAKRFGRESLGLEASGTVILLTSVTGVPLGYERHMTAWIEEVQGPVLAGDRAG